MFNTNEYLAKWLKEFENFSFEDYENLPDIDLYMDQVITYLDRKFQILQTSSLDKVITSSMINNYVKGKVISAPVSKKYNREHIALIEEVCSLKQVLSITEIKQIFDELYKDVNILEPFNTFKDEAKKNTVMAAQETLLNLENIEVNDMTKLNTLALNLALKAQSYITVAKRILFLTRHYQAMLLEEENKDEKHKRRDEKKED